MRCCHLIACKYSGPQHHVQRYVATFAAGLGFKDVQTISDNSASSFNVAAVLSWSPEVQPCTFGGKRLRHPRDVDRPFSIKV